MLRESARQLLEVWVKAIFDDGTRLVVVPDPVGGPPSTGSGPGAVVLANPNVQQRAKW